MKQDEAGAAPPEQPQRSPEEVIHLFQVFVAAARSITLAEAADLVNALNRQETLQPLLDPTAWREVADSLSAHRRLAEAFLEFRREIERIAPAAQGETDHAAG